MARVIPGPVRRVLGLVFPPSRQSRQLAASMAIASNTASPMASGTSPYGLGGYTGDTGYGVNRWGGDTPPLQRYYSVTAPITHPDSAAVGYGSGVSGQPGMPQAGDGGMGYAEFSTGPGAGMGA